MFDYTTVKNVIGSDVALSQTMIDSINEWKKMQNGAADLNENLQDGLALGSFVLRPLGADRAEYVAADKLIPVSFDDSGKPNDIAFLSVKCIGKNDYYTRVERHYFTNGNLTIEN